jgi:hypothetical protein
MKRPQGSTRRPVNDTCTRVAIERVEVQVITTDFLREGDEQEPPKDQVRTDVHARIPNLSQLECWSFPLGSTAIVPEVPINARTRYERIFQVVCGL